MSGTVAVTPSARRFSRAAQSYDDAAQLQRDVADALLTSLPAGLEPRCVLDAGCGTGYVTRALARRYPAADSIGLDLAPGMLDRARETQGGLPIRWRQGDIEALPLADDSVDLLVSSMTLQWCVTPALFLAEAARVLRPGGVLAFTTLLAGSLAELARVDSSAVNSFITPQALAAQIDAMPFTGLHESDRLHYSLFDQPLALLRSLSATGATTLMARRPSGLAGRRRLKQLVAGLERQRTDDGIALVWRVASRVVRRSAVAG